MNEHPILFSAPMVQANLDDRKTMTRRMTGLDKINDNPDVYEYHGMLPDNPYIHVFARMWKGNHVETVHMKCIYGKTGDLLWVRETVGKQWSSDSVGGCKTKFIYKADGTELQLGMHWKPSIHMPKAASRIWLEVEEVLVERLNEISSQDAIHEGIENSSPATWKDYLNKDSYCENPIMSFKSLFISINGKPSPNREIGNYGNILSYTAIAWDQEDFDKNWSKFNGIYHNKPLEVIINPWVWVVRYKVLSTTGKPDMCYKTGEVCK